MEKQGRFLLSCCVTTQLQQQPVATAFQGAPAIPIQKGTWHVSLHSPPNTAIPKMRLSSVVLKCILEYVDKQALSMESAPLQVLVLGLA